MLIDGTNGNDSYYGKTLVLILSLWRQGDPDAIGIILQHFGPAIARLSPCRRCTTSAGTSILRRPTFRNG